MFFMGMTCALTTYRLASKVDNKFSNQRCGSMVKGGGGYNEIWTWSTDHYFLKF